MTKSELLSGSVMMLVLESVAPVSGPGMPGAVHRGERREPRAPPPAPAQSPASAGTTQSRSKEARSNIQQRINI